MVAFDRHGHFAARLSAHIGYLFSEYPLAERLAMARRYGFAGVEHPSPYSMKARDMAAALKETGLSFVQFACPAGDAAKGEKGIAALPGKTAEFRAGVEMSLDYAEEIDCGLLHVMAAVRPKDDDDAALWQTYIENLEFAADAARRRGITILIEPIGPGTIPDYLVDEPAKALLAIEKVGRDNVRMLFDVFHTTNAGLDPVSIIDAHAALIAHVHIADFPGRHEPGSGMMDHAAICTALAQHGYEGFLGFEYIPAQGTEAGLGWMR